MKLHPYLCATIVAIIFGFSFLFTKNALDFVTANQLMAVRFSVAAITMTVLWAIKAIRINLKGKPLWKVLVLAIFQPVIYFFYETLGVDLTSSSEAGLVIALIPVFVTILGAIFLKEIPNMRQTICVILSVMGVVLIVLGGDPLVTSSHIFGFLALLIADLSAAAYHILSRYLSPSFKPVELTFVMMWVGALFFGGLAVFDILRRPTNIDSLLFFVTKREVWGAILYLGIISSVVAFFGMNYNLSKIEASRAAVFSSFSTIISVIAGYFFRGEGIYWIHIVGGTFILLGVWGVNKFAQSQIVQTSPKEV